MDDRELQPLLLGHLAKLLGIRGEPVFSNIAHWPETMPQYHVGHKQLVERIRARAAELPNFQLIGSAYRGVGLPDCVHQGQMTAEKVVERLKEMQRSAA